MKRSDNYAIVLVTAPDMRVARRLANVALESRLVACVNLVRHVESRYWWRGKLESSAEVLVILKTTKARLSSLEKLIVANHPYDTPEFVVLPVSAGNKRYLDWLSKSVG